jgi:alkylation response protein AidB-like acyl-CoA dehydrogenase
MRTGLTREQQLLRESTARLVEQSTPTTRVRELFEEPAGFDRDTWLKGADLGWYSMLVPEDLGGGSVSGDGLVDLAVVAEEMGRALFPGPFLPTNVVAYAVAEYGDDGQRERWLPGLLTGESVGTWAFAEPDGPWSPDGVRVAARPDGDGIVLTGVKAYVQDALSADVLLVTARALAGLTQVLVPADAPGLTMEPLETLDLGRRLATVRLDAVRVPGADVLGVVGGAADAVERQRQVALVLQCAESNGVTDAGFGLTVQYSKDRVAFGRPIGSYQALKHRMATHRVWLEGAFATAAYAAESVAAGRADAPLAVRVAKAHVGRTSTAVLHDCIQLHGGIAMTWDYDLHLFLRRAISNEVLYGSPGQLQRELVDLQEATSRAG